MLGQTKTSGAIGDWQAIPWAPAGQPSATDNVSIVHDAVVIPENTTVKVNDLNIGNGGNLIVNGNLIVQGNLDMDNNSNGFSMGPSSTVVVFGNLSVNNKVELSISSYLIIYGDFENKGSSNQGSFDITNASIYVFGDVSGNGFPDSFGCSDNYSGSTSNVDESCDYGNENDYEDNQEDIPSDIVDLLNCYDLSTIKNYQTCPGQDAVFSVPTYPNVKYQWQEKSPANSTWTNVGTDNYQLILSGVTTSMNDNLYRVVVTPTNGSSCTISISRNVTLKVNNTNIWTGATSSDWETSSNWSCNSLPDLTTEVLIQDGPTNFPVLISGSLGKAGNITLQGTATLEVLGTLQIGGSLNSNGGIDASNGTVELLGNSVQQLPAASFLNNRIDNLFINNTSGVNLLGELEISGILNVQAGNLNSNAFLTLISEAGKTALIDGAGNGQILGSVTMQRYLESGFGYKYVSTPFNNSTVGDFSAYVDLDSSFPHVYTYNEARENSNNEDASGWTPYTSATNSLNIMEGYAMNFGSSSDALTIEISGEVNNGDYSATLQNSSGEFTKGFNLIGNPYPSPINWDVGSGWTKANIDDAIYFFESSSTDQYGGTYTSYVSGISSSAGTSGIIPSMQGFFVKVSDGFSSGNIGMTNEVRSQDFSRDFYRQQENSRNTQRSLLRITAGFADQSHSDAMVIYFSPANHSKFEKDKDALKLMNTDINVPSIYSLNSENTKFSINGTSFSEENRITRIPLGIKTNRSGWINLELTTRDNLNSGFLYLIDKDRKTAKDLSIKKDLKVFLEKGIFESRFELLFSESPIENLVETFQHPLLVSNANGETTAQYKLEQTQKGWLQVINLNGQILGKYLVQGEGNLEVKGIKSSGLYIFTLATDNGRFTKKVLINL